MIAGLTTGQWVNLAGSLLMIALAVATLWTRPRATVNRALAAYCAGFGGFTILTTFTLGRPVVSGAYAFPLGGALAAVGGASIALFALVHPHRVRREERRAVALAALLVAPWPVVSVVSVTLRWEDLILYWRIPAGLDGAFAAMVVGWNAFYAGTMFALALFTLRYRALAPGRPAAEIALLCGVLALYPASDMGATFTAQDGARPSLALVWSLFALVLAAIWLRNGRAGDARHARWVAWTILAATLAGMLWAVVSRDPFITIRTGIAGVARTLGAAIIVYAIVRHQLLGIDVKVKWTLTRSTVAAIFLAVVFVASEGAQLLLGDDRAWLGLLAGAALVFALAPLQRFAERVSEIAMPGVRAPAEMSAEERLQLYRDQVQAAYMDGSVDGSERRLLERLRERLGIDAEEAMRIEREVTP